MSKPWTLEPDRLFDPNPARRSLARSLYTEVEDLPIVGPHGHVPPALLADQDATLGTPTERCTGGSGLTQGLISP